MLIFKILPLAEEKNKHSKLFVTCSTVFHVRSYLSGHVGRFKKKKGRTRIMEDAKNIEMFAERQLFLLPLLLITT